MSYSDQRDRRGGGYHHRPYNGDSGYHSQMQREENRVRQIRSVLFKLGEEKDFHTPSDLLKLSRWVEERAKDGLEPITAAFRIMVTEQPHKTPLIAALIGFLVLAPHTDDAVGFQVVKDLEKAFRTYLDARLWRNTRLTLHLFAALVPLGIVSAQDLTMLLGAFAAVLDEPGVAASRGDRAAVCIIETLCRGAQDLILDGNTVPLDQLVDKVVSYNASRKVEVELASPFSGPEAPEGLQEEAFEHSVAAVQALREQGYRRPAFLPTPSDLLPSAISASATQVELERRTITLPDILVPPDEEEQTGMDVAFASLGERVRAHRKVDTGADERRAGAGPDRVSRQARWFAATVPQPSTPCSVVLRAMIADMIDLYEINRKEAAKLVLDLPNWLRRGTFAVSPDDGLFGEADDEWPTPHGWSLDDFIVETVIATAMILPSSPRNVLYYTSLLREVVSATPGTIAPSLGKTIRTFYAAMGTGKLDVEVMHRFADWFSIHLSNFNFGWAWKEWVADVALPAEHPKRVFMRRVVELEVRLAYYDRVKQTLPAEVAEVCLASEEPGPSFDYAEHEHAQRLINSIKAKATAPVILADFESFKASLGPEAEPEATVRDIAIQCILHVGSRSFSHFLNIVERYHSLLRTLSSEPSMRLAILRGAARFWARSAQWVQIVLDKLLQYRIVEPADVVEFLFEKERMEWCGFDTWALLRMTLNKVNGRVDQLRKRLEDVEREEERLAAAKEENEEEQEEQEEQLPLFPTSASLPVKPPVSTAADAKTALESIQAEQRKVLVRVVQGFAALRAQSTDQWTDWWISSWYAEFVRLFNKQILANRQIIASNTDTDEVLERALDMLSE